MSEIRRWEIQLSIEPEDGEVRAHITEAPDGYLVLHSYYATERTAREAAEAAVARMEGELAGLRAMLQRIADNGFSGPTWSAVRAPTHAELRALLEGGAG